MGKKLSVEDTKRKIKDLLDKLKDHKYAYLMNQPLDKSN